MKIAFLHLSDMHFSCNHSFKQANIDNITASLQRHCSGVDGIIIIVSGDLTYSGFYYQSKQVELFFTTLITTIKEKYHFTDVYIFMVPGNHDINYKIHSYSAEELSEIKKHNLYQKNYSAELDKEKHALNVCRKFDCLTTLNSLVSKHQLTFGEIVIGFNLINTAPFSALCEDKGFHYLPSKDIANLCSNTSEDFSFTIMHHPYHYFNDAQFNQLEKILINRSDIIFVGHEHYSKIRAISDDNTTVSIYAGGMLCNQGNWEKSEFHVGVLDTDSRIYDITAYNWSSKEKLYISTNMGSRVLGKSKTSCLGIPVRESYKNELLADKKYEISSNLLDYYVFPLLEEQPRRINEDGREIENAESFLEYIDEKKKIVIIGQGGSGKTVTCKFIFSYFSDKKIVLMLNGHDIHDKNYERLIKNIFEDTFSVLPAKYDIFLAANKSEKVIIIDDIHLIPEVLQVGLLEFLDKQFGTILLTMQSEIELNIFDRLNQRFLTVGYECCRIRSMYADKRENLVGKIANLLLIQEDSRERAVMHICDNLAKHNAPYVWNAEFVTQLTKYICDNIGFSMTNDGDTFSKVFEHNLTSLLGPHAKKIKVDKIFFILGKIAYEIHISPSDHKKYPIHPEDICSVIREYNNDYNSDIDPVHFIDVLLKSNIFKNYDNGYVFTERNYLAYFIAREIKQRIQENDVVEFIKALDYACFGINADVILFVTYICDNPNIIRWIMDKADAYSDRWKEFEVSPVNIPYLSDVDQLKPVTFTLEDRKDNKQKKVQREKQSEERRLLINPPDVYAYDENNLQPIDELIRSLSLTIILSRALPSFEHLLLGKDKKRCVKLLYELPLRIFYAWASDIERNKPQLISEIREMLTINNLDEWEYRRDSRKVTDIDALTLLRSESVLLLLELMNSTMYNATRADTIRYIDEFNYLEKTTYSIEHLMSQERRNNKDDFVNEAIKIREDTKTQLIDLLICHVARHFLITTRKLDYKQIQKLNDKIFDGRLNKPGLLLMMHKNEKR